MEGIQFQIEEKRKQKLLYKQADKCWDEILRSIE